MLKWVVTSGPQRQSYLQSHEPLNSTMLLTDLCSQTFKPKNEMDLDAFMLKFTNTNQLKRKFDEEKSLKSTLKSRRKQNFQTPASNSVNTLPLNGIEYSPEEFTWTEHPAFRCIGSYNCSNDILAPSAYLKPDIFDKMLASFDIMSTTMKADDLIALSPDSGHDSPSNCSSSARKRHNSSSKSKFDFQFEPRLSKRRLSFSHSDAS